MSNFKMQPGSKEKDTPGGTSEKQTVTARELFQKKAEKAILPQP